VPASAGVELGRFVLLDHQLLAANAETCLSRAFRFARRELSAAGIVAYCDPLPRVDESGAVVKRGHTGTIYSAHNGRYAGPFFGAHADAAAKRPGHQRTHPIEAAGR
jgi:hypothetical protein